jgi:hypothetical protein
VKNKDYNKNASENKKCLSKAKNASDQLEAPQTLRGVFFCRLVFPGIRQKHVENMVNSCLHAKNPLNPSMFIPTSTRFYMKAWRFAFSTSETSDG